jgi:hypothetical protein
MKRYLPLALALAVLSLPSIASACNCQATRAQRWLAYKAYKENVATKHERLLAEQQRENQQKINAPRKAVRKGSASVGKSEQDGMQPKGK